MRLRRRWFIFIALCTFLLLIWFYKLVIDLQPVKDNTPLPIIVNKESHLEHGNEKASANKIKISKKFAEVVLNGEVFYKCHSHW